MNEKVTQAIIRLVRLAIVAVITVLIANAADIIGLVPDENLKYLLALVLVPVLDAIAKVIGGPTQPMLESVGRGAGEAAPDRPNFLSV